MAGIMPAMMGIVLSLLGAAAQAAEGGSSPAPAIVPAGLSSEALIAQAQAASRAGDLVAAREALEHALRLDPGNETARTLLARVDSQAGGRPVPLERDPVGGDVRQQAALAEARMQVGRAELLAAGGRFEDAIVLVSQSRVALQPYLQDAGVREETQHLDALLAAYRERHLVTRDLAQHEARRSARVEAEGRQRLARQTAAAVISERIARIEELDKKGFIETALASCRRLVNDYPGNAQVEQLQARLITRSHKQRDLSIAEQREELLQETVERLERSLIPSGFDGWPTFPVDFDQRHAERSGFDAPARLDAADEALNEKLATRLSYQLVEQNAIEVLTALAKQSGVNLIVDPSVAAKGDSVITLKATDITFRNTLSWICRLANTTWYVDRGAVYVGGEQESRPIFAIYDVSELLFNPKDQVGKQLAFAGAAAGTGGGAAGGGGGAGFNLFAAAPMDDTAPAISPEDLIDHIQKAVSPAIWSNNAYGITVRGTTLLVTAPTSVHLLIQQFIRSQSNQKSKLVRVSARWLTIVDGYLEEIGVDWRSDNFLNPAPINPTLLQYPVPTSPHIGVDPTQNGYHRQTSQFDHSGSLVNNLPAAAAVPDASALASTGLNLQAMLLNSTRASAILSAVERNGKGTVLEAPEVVTMNGVRANTFMGIQYAYIGDYQAGAAAGTLDGTLDPDIGVLNLGAVLDIKPYVSADGKYVTMEFKPAIASLQNVLHETITTQRFIPLNFLPGGGNNGNGNGVIVGQLVNNAFGMDLPNILIRSVATNIVVPDGGTILVGGFGKYLEQTMSTKIPFLGHIPFLGRLFGKRGRYSDRYKLYLLADIQIINYAELEAKL